jgi:hypothetical protein
VPDDFADDLQVQLADRTLKHRIQQRNVTQSFRVASVCVHEPFSADDHRINDPNNGSFA